MIGHSLGAHVMGFGGRWLKNKNMTVARVTGRHLNLIDSANIY